MAREVRVNMDGCDISPSMPLFAEVSGLLPSLSRGPVGIGMRPVGSPSQRHRALLGLMARIEEKIPGENSWWFILIGGRAAMGQGTQDGFGDNTGDPTIGAINL